MVKRIGVSEFFTSCAILRARRLPASNASDLDQPFLRLLELARHVIERLHRRGDFCPTLFAGTRMVKIPRRHAFQPLRQLPYRAADARGQKYQCSQRSQP